MAVMFPAPSPTVALVASDGLFTRPPTLPPILELCQTNTMIGHDRYCSIAFFSNVMGVLSLVVAAVAHKLKWNKVARAMDSVCSDQ